MSRASSGSKFGFEPEETAPDPLLLRDDLLRALRSWFDQRLVTCGVTWQQYELQLALRGDRSAPRIAYLDGALELMRPSKDHERIKSYIGRLVEAYALERGIESSPYGSWTLKRAPKEAGLEPDECYLVGDQSRDTPDLAIEVVWTSVEADPAPRTSLRCGQSRRALSS